MMDQISRGLCEVSYFPTIDIAREKDKIVLKADLPGLKKEDIHLTVEDGILNIASERNSETEEKNKKCPASTNSL